MLMFIIPFILILILVLIIWIVRSSATKLNQARGRPPPSFAAMRSTTTNETIPPTLGNVARDVTSHMFTHSQHSAQDTGVGRRSGDPYVPFHRRDQTGEGVGVNRLTSESQASLPVYGADTLPAPPEAIYESGRERQQRYISTSAGLPLYAEAPPKYTAVIDNRQTVI